VLVIFEVLKSTPKNKDYMIQFTAAEIDGMLGVLVKWGRIGTTEIKKSFQRMRPRRIRLFGLWSSPEDNAFDRLSMAALWQLHNNPTIFSGGIL